MDRSSSGLRGARQLLADHRDRHLQQRRLGSWHPTTPAHQPAWSGGWPRTGGLGGGAASCPIGWSSPATPSAPRRLRGGHHPHQGWPQTNGHVENLHKTILEECWRPSFARTLYPAFTALRRDLRYMAYEKRLTAGDVDPRERCVRDRTPVGTSGGETRLAATRMISQVLPGASARRRSAVASGQSSASASAT